MVSRGCIATCLAAASASDAVAGVYRDAHREGETPTWNTHIIDYWRQDLFDFCGGLPSILRIALRRGTRSELHNGNKRALEALMFQ